MMDRRKALFLPFPLFLLLLLLGSVLGQVEQPSPSLASASELKALFSLRSSLGLRAKYWPRNANPCIKWVGVKCANGSVLTLSISGLRRTRLGRLNPRFDVEGLANLTHLTAFNASGFRLPGSIPEWMGQRLRTLEMLDLRFCSISGFIPDLGGLQNLAILYLAGNSISGSVPETLGQLTRLTELDLSRNFLTGTIPANFSGLSRLTFLDLSANFLSSTIPPALGTLSNLTNLILSNNSLSGSIPAQLSQLSSLVELDLSFNSLSGSLLRDFGGMVNLQKLNVERNSLSDQLPANLFSNLTQLRSVLLGGNNFSGPLPNVWVLPELQRLDVSFNNFTGNLAQAVPSITSANVTGVFNLSRNLFYGRLPFQLDHLSFIDLSYNYFEGKNSGIKVLNATLDGNCLQNTRNQRSLQFCDFFYRSIGLEFDGSGSPPQPSPASGKKKNNLRYILGGVFGGLAFIVLLVLAVILFVRRLERGRGLPSDQREVPTNQVSTGSGKPYPGININFSSLGDSYSYELLIKATSGFGEMNLIRHGHSGDLYRGALENGSPVVVKRIDLRRFKKDAYLAELDVFSRALHGRLVPLLGHCLEQENEKLLVYKYMPNGDLCNALFRKSDSEEDGLQSLDWITRLKIATGAAEALSYLHHECSPPLVHRDVQASSILLDDKFEVCLGSLSEVCTQEGDTQQNVISRLLRLSQSSEQGFSGSSSANCAYDVYCFGKVLLELITGKLGISGSNDATTREWLEDALSHINTIEKESLTKIVDPTLIVDEDLLEEVWAMSIVAKTCLNAKPSKRPLARYILKALENPLKVVREENTGSARLRTTSSRGSWNAAFFGSWRRSSSDIVAAPSLIREAGSFKASGTLASHGIGQGGDVSASHKRPSKEIFPEPATDVERLEED